jgi:hypothetical protein
MHAVCDRLRSSKLAQAYVVFTPHFGKKKSCLRHGSDVGLFSLAGRFGKVGDKWLEVCRVYAWFDGVVE